MDMKTTTSLKILLFASLLSLQATAREKFFRFQGWTLSVETRTGETSILKDGRIIIHRSCATWGTDSALASMSHLGGVTAKATGFKDALGEGCRITLEGHKDGATVSQSFCLYKGQEWITTQLAVTDRRGVALNVMRPLSCTMSYSLFRHAGNAVISIPFDNDAWVRYCQADFGSRVRESYEVTAIMNKDTREGLIVGSVDHDTWKTGIHAVTSGTVTVDTLLAGGGAYSSLTRDTRSHGTVRGTTVASPRIMIGLFADWRDGMETYGDICSAVAPKLAVPSALPSRPFGWNSWGKIASKITYDKAIEAADFIKDNLQGDSFNDAQGRTVINLDAFWDFGLSQEQRRQFAQHCKANGQIAGIYFCPFTDWGKNPEAVVAEMPEYKYKDVYLYVDGKPLDFDGAYAIDPTHPAVQARIRKQLAEFIDWGYEYLKIDFMAHGAFQADSYYDKSVTTGVQAYNAGMRVIDEAAQGKLWLNLSIAPLFPANYAQSRRIGCDAWADINNTEYTLNGLTYGWWLDHVYTNNDADHIVLEGVTEGENRARITSSAITGVFFLGDDLSKDGSRQAQGRIRRLATNNDICEMARQCRSFRPVEIGMGDRGADIFEYRTDKALYVAVFNLTDKSARKILPMRRLNLQEARNYRMKELWSGDSVTMKGNIDTEVPAKDVKVFRIVND